MIIKQNLHTHTTYCDGKDTPREIIEEAIKRGFDSIGFSGHSHMMHDSYKIFGRPEKTSDYYEEISRLKEEYSNKIKIFCGIEYDMYTGCDISYFDYSIGAMHYLKIGDKMVGFDRIAVRVKEVIDNCFGGNGMEYAKEYYKQLGELPNYAKFDIIGHFDIITKHIDNENFFDYKSEEYLSAAFEAAGKLKGKIPYFEVNTGAISRGYRKTPYPAEPILKELLRLGFGAVITSDCHDKNMLDCHFTEAEKLLKKCGFKERYVLTENGFCPIII